MNPSDLQPAIDALLEKKLCSNSEEVWECVAEYLADLNKVREDFRDHLEKAISHAENGEFGNEVILKMFSLQKVPGRWTNLAVEMLTWIGNDLCTGKVGKNAPQELVGILEAVCSLEENPYQGMPYLLGTRRLQIPATPFQVVYWVVDDTIEVLNVLVNRLMPLNLWSRPQLKIRRPEPKE